LQNCHSTVKYLFHLPLLHLNLKIIQHGSKFQELSHEFHLVVISSIILSFK